MLKQEIISYLIKQNRLFVLNKALMTGIKNAKYVAFEGIGLKEDVGRLTLIEKKHDHFFLGVFHIKRDGSVNLMLGLRSEKLFNSFKTLNTLSYVFGRTLFSGKAISK